MMNLSKNFLLKAFTTASNIGIIAGLKATGALAVTINPISLGAVTTIGASAIVSGILIGGYKTWKSAGTQKDFVKNVLTHSAFGFIGGGIGFFADDIWDLGKTIPFVSSLTAGLKDSFDLATTWLNDPPKDTPVPYSRDYLSYDFTGTPTQTRDLENDGFVVRTPANAPPVDVVMNQLQSMALAHAICDEIDGCMWDGPEHAIFSQSQQSLQSTNSLVLDLSGHTDCDTICASGRATLTCANFQTSTQPIAVHFDMEQGMEFLEIVCDNTNFCQVSGANLISAPAFAPDTNITRSSSEAGEILNEGDPTGDIPIQHVVQRGDNLWDIAEAIYGDGTKYTLIVEANLELYPSLSNPDLIYPEMVLTIPRIDEIGVDCSIVKGQTYCSPSLRLAA